MKTKLNLLHLTVGIITVLVFLATGLLMRFHLSRVFETNYFVRMLFRSSHIYILLAGLLNIALGAYLRLSESHRKRAVQIIGSICVLMAPAVLIAAFFYEPYRESLNRPLTPLAMLLLLIGTLCHMLTQIGARDT